MLIGRAIPAASCASYGGIWPLKARPTGIRTDH